jgi:DNA ligase-associated metallophosphoesterase
MLTALPSGALWYGAARLLCVSDLHMGKSDRIVRLRGLMLPPYETRETLDRLAADIDRCDPQIVVCLGDSFDDPAAAGSLDDDDRTRLTLLQAGRLWVWISGNHDPTPVDLGGTGKAQHRAGPLVFRHIAEPGATAEVSGHYHPKHGLPGTGGLRPAFLIDATRVIMPAFGTYTGGLRAGDAALTALMSADTLAVLTGRRAIALPCYGTGGPPSRPAARTAGR